jgi:hypothetical protein
MLKQDLIISTLNKVFHQTPKLRKGTDAVYFCPVCKHYKRKLEVSLVTGKYNCWVCNFRGLSYRSLFKKLNAPSEAYSALGEFETYKFSSTYSNDEEPERPKLPDEFKQMAVPSKDKVYYKAIQYLKERNVTKCDILRYNIGYCDTGLYANRIIIPSYDADGNVNFFSARDITGYSYAKYRLSGYSKNIIGFELFINFEEPITLVEGQFDAISVRKNAIPLFGKGLSKKLKARLLESDVPRVNVLLDNDAHEDAIEICRFLVKNEIPAHLVKLEDKDPSILGFSKTWEYINNSPEMTFKSLLHHKLKL